VVTTFGTAGIVVNSAVFRMLPGLDVTITVPDNAMVFVTADGGMTVNSGMVGVSAVADVALFVDSFIVPNAGFKRVTATNLSFAGAMAPVGIGNWSLAEGMTLAAGTHQFQVAARLPFGSTTAVVSGGGGSVAQGQLSVAIVKK
jgi:hypothetical protein